MENQRTNGFDGKLSQDEKVGFSKIEVSAPKQISITLPYGTTIKLATRDVGFLAELLCQMDNTLKQIACTKNDSIPQCCYPDKSKKI